jgi:hypothetical protein
MAKRTDVSYTGKDSSSHTRIDKMPGVNVGHNPRTGAVESLKTPGPRRVELSSKSSKPWTATSSLAAE